MSDDPSTVLLALRELSSKAFSTGDKDDAWVAVYAYQAHEGLFKQRVRESPKAAFEYFSDRITLETMAYTSEPDDIATENRISLSRAFISIFPDLEAAGELRRNDMIEDGMYRQICRDLADTIRKEIISMITSGNGRAALKDHIESLIRKPDFGRTFGLLVKHCTFSPRFIDYAQMLQQYGRLVSGRKSILTILTGAKNGESEIAEMVALIDRYKDAMKRG